MKLLEKIYEIINGKNINVRQSVENLRFDINLGDNEVTRYAIMKEIENICSEEIKELENRENQIENKEILLKKKEQKLSIELEYNVDLLKKQLHLDGEEKEKERIKLSIENIELKEKIKQLKEDVSFFKDISKESFSANNEALIESSKRTVNITNNTSN